MHWYSTVILLLLNSAFGFPRGKVTEKPEIPPISNPVVNKNRKPPIHISDFTDPDTGLNPFVDIEEGQTSLGRNVMEDEIRDDTPYFDMDLVEGDAPNRRWGFQEPKETSEKIPEIGRWPAIDYKDENYDFPVMTTPLIPLNPTTTISINVPLSTDIIKQAEKTSDGELQHKVIKDEKRSFVVSQNTVIYASVTIAAVAMIILIIGAFWWRRKLTVKVSQSTRRAMVENCDVKS